jgi:serine/threonine-protein kinase
MEAVQAYQRGREMWEARDDALYLILQEYKRAAALDPRFARAHLGQGQVYAFMYGSGTEAETAISRALELDPSLGEAWATRAFVRAFQHWDWVGAEAAFARALALDPENATTLQWLANVRMVQRRFPEARALLTRAITRAPEYGVLHADLCELHYYLRDLEAARAACQRAAALSPDVTFIYRNLQYIELLDREGDSHARRRLSTEDRQAFDSTTRARMWARIGQRDSTLGMVELAVAERAFIAPFLNADPHFDFVRGDPRWQRAMARMGL